METSYSIEATETSVGFHIGYPCVSFPYSNTVLKFTVTGNSDYDEISVTILSVTDDIGTITFTNPIDEQDRIINIANPLKINIYLSDVNFSSFVLTWTDKTNITNEGVITNSLTIPEKSITDYSLKTSSIKLDFSISSTSLVKKINDQVFTATISDSSACYQMEAGNSDLTIKIKEFIEIEIIVYPDSAYDDSDENTLELKQGRFITAFMKIKGIIQPISAATLSVATNPTNIAIMNNQLNLPAIGLSAAPNVEYENKITFQIGCPCPTTSDFSQKIITLTPSDTDNYKTFPVTITFNQSKAKLSYSTIVSPVDRISTQDIKIFLSEVNYEIFKFKWEKKDMNTEATITPVEISVPANTVTNSSIGTSSVVVKFNISSSSTSQTLTNQMFTTTNPNLCYEWESNEITIGIKEVSVNSGGSTSGGSNSDGSNSDGSNSDGSNSDGSNSGGSSSGGSSSGGSSSGGSSSGDPNIVTYDPNIVTYDPNDVNSFLPPELQDILTPGIVLTNPKPIIKFPASGGDAKISDFIFDFRFIATLGGMCFATSHQYSLRCIWMVSDLPEGTTPTVEQLKTCDEKYMCGSFIANPYRKTECGQYPEHWKLNKKYPLHLACIINTYGRYSDVTLMGYVIGRNNYYYADQKYNTTLKNITIDPPTDYNTYSNAGKPYDANSTITSSALALKISSLIILVLLYLTLN